MRSLVLSLLATTMLVVLSSTAAATSRAASASATGSGAPETPDIPLPPLEQLPAIESPAPSQEAVQSLETRLDELVTTEVAHPLAEVDFRFLLGDLSNEIVPAIGQRLQVLREQIKSNAARKLLEKARKAGRKAIRKQRKKGQSKKDDPEGDWLVFTLSLAAAGSQDWRDLTELYGMLRMLEAVGTTPAARQLVGCYSYFGELVRIDLQRSMARMKDKAVPALIEAKRHDAPKVRRWARRQLDSLGRAIPGEAVSTTDPIILADVLRAFGRNRDVEATRVVLSFVNNDRVQLRDAARQAIAAIGEPATWHLKDTYKNLTGTKPPRSWDWKRTAREIFRLHDRARLSTVFELWDVGHAALQKDDLVEATKAFDQVLARVPLFAKRSEMVPAYVGRAEQLMKSDKRDEALVAFRKALRLLPADADKKKIESRVAQLEAEELIEQGTPDRLLLERAVELDPENEDARKLLDSLEQTAEKRETRSKRYFGAIAVGVVGMIALILLGWRRKAEPEKQRRRGSASASGSESGSESESESESASESTSGGVSD